MLALGVGRELETFAGEERMNLQESQWSVEHSYTKKCSNYVHKVKRIE